MSLQEERKHSIDLSDISSAEAYLGLCKTSMREGYCKYRYSNFYMIRTLMKLL